MSVGRREYYNDYARVCLGSHLGSELSGYGGGGREGGGSEPCQCQFHEHIRTEYNTEIPGSRAAYMVQRECDSGGNGCTALQVVDKTSGPWRGVHANRCMRSQVEIGVFNYMPVL
ncbi:hypothetical protein HL42_0528 [Trichophyton rubrum]|nr:hypothetical protein HL42_0528 [Trichophyton rubrum]